MHVKAIGTKKSEILAKITFLGIFGQILPNTPIVTETVRDKKEASSDRNTSKITKINPHLKYLPSNM